MRDITSALIGLRDQRKGSTKDTSTTQDALHKICQAINTNPDSAKSLLANITYKLQAFETR